jgi:DNA primase
MAKWSGNNYSDVDVESLFSSEGVPFRTSGKNISAGWIGVNCPFCGEQNNHCGVNLDSKRYSCWVCSASGTLAKLVGVLLGLTYGQANKIIDGHRGFRYDAPIRELSKEVIMPSHMSELTKIGRTYLKRRGFDPDEIIKKYHLKETNMFSYLKIKDDTWDFRWRIIIPIIMEREIVTYTGRDFTNSIDPRYRNAPIEAGTMLTSECVYNLDSITDKALIVEGPTDVWKLGDEAIATLGVKFSHSQINKILQKELKKIVILFDAGAEGAARILADALNPYVRNLKVFIVQDMDPGSMDMIEAHKLKYDLLGGR